MFGRSVVHGIGILAAIALLAAVLSSSIRPAGPSRTAPCPGSLPRNFAVLKAGPDGPSSAMAGPCLGMTDALPTEIDLDDQDAEIEDDLTATFPTTHSPSEALSSPGHGPRPERGRLAASPAARPLRC